MYEQIHTKDVAFLLILPPSVVLHTVNITTSGSPVAGQMYTLICNGTLVGNTSLTPVVTWRNSTGVVTSGNGITVSNGILTFNPLRTSHGGQYTCQFTLGTLNSTITSSTLLTVQSNCTFCTLCNYKYFQCYLATDNQN